MTSLAHTLLAPTARPFLKSAGGKTRLLPQLLERLPEGFEQMRYVEPFVGGGALFFAVVDRLRRPRDVLLSDANADLVGVYRAVRDDVEVLIDNLAPFALEHSAQTYALARDALNASRENLETLSPTERAAIYVYLNRTCFNGLYRVNKSGDFNVPMGNYTNPRICDAVGLRAAHSALQWVGVLCTEDFEKILRSLEVTRPGENFVYLDPPYAPVGEQNFVNYTRDGFDWADQLRLRETFKMLDQRGNKIMMSNSPAVRELYAGYRVEVVQAPRSVNSSGAGRGLVDEIIVRNY